jgi:hypothetical protein
LKTCGPPLDSGARGIVAKRPVDKSGGCTVKIQISLRYLFATTCYGKHFGHQTVRLRGNEIQQFRIYRHLFIARSPRRCAPRSGRRVALADGLVLLSLMGILCFYAVELAERLLCPWYLPVSTAAKL